MNDESIDKLDREIEDGVKTAFSKKAVPEGLWQRIQESAESQIQAQGTDRPRIRSTWLPVSIAASVLIVTAGLLITSLFPRNTSDMSMTQALVGEHATFVASGRDLDISSSDINALSKWFNQRLDSSLPPDAPITSGLKLAGGRLCQIKGKRIASYAYRSGGVIVSLYITKSGDKPDTYALTVESPARPEISNINSSNYASWKKSGWQYFLVGDIPTEQFKKISTLLSSGPLQQDS